MRTGFPMAWVLAAVATAALGCGSDGYGDPGGAPAPPQCTAATATALTGGTVTLSGNAFSPACARVPPGSTVTFVNADIATHTVTADSGAFDHLVSSGQQVARSFPAAGTVGIHCTIHPGMRMTLLVQ